MSRKIFINDVSDKYLLDLFSNSCRHIVLAKRGRHHMELEQLQLDNDHIMREVDRRLPASYRWQIEKIAFEQTTPEKDIRPGNRYKHNTLGMFQLQIVDTVDYNGPIFTVRAFIGRHYLCRILVKQATILAQFTPI